jgi:hypothetical protein
MSISLKISWSAFLVGRSGADLNGSLPSSASPDSPSAQEDRSRSAHERRVREEPPRPGGMSPYRFARIQLRLDTVKGNVMSRRTPLVVLGAVLLAIAGFAIVAGAFLVAVFGSGNVLATGPQSVATSTRALVSTAAEFDGLREAPSLLGQARIEIEATTRDAGRGVFVGVAAADDVDRYLAAADVDIVTDVRFLPFRLTTEHRPGAGSVPVPGTQHFWVARAAVDNGTARLSWPVRDGDYRIVLMNADGSPNVDVDARFALVIPSAPRVGVIVLAVGLATALIGAVVLTFGLLSPSTGPQPPRAGSRPPAAGSTPVASPGTRGARTAATTTSEGP